MRPIRAVFWDFGGVILDSPFDAFRRHEEEKGLPRDFIRRLNTTNPDTNAWARFERSEVDLDAFCALFEEEARQAGHPLDARAVVALLAGEVRPEMVAALRAVKAAGYKTACLTNNVTSSRRTPEKARQVAEIMALFDAVVESSKAGARKPEPRFYTIACEMLGVEPDETVFLDDLGINLKPARALGMRTIKVETPEQALAELEEVLGHPIR
jgi:putative hydrolase of the HAD superfamily